MANYKTPGVYVQEISNLPPSAVAVETALPAFIGYTEKAEQNGNNLTNTPTRISSMLEFVRIFGAGGGLKQKFQVETKGDSILKVDLLDQYYLSDAVRMFYANGGGDCYIVSVGPFKETGGADQGELLKGLDTLREVEEPTMLVMPDALKLDVDACYGVQVQMLKQCGDMQSRVAILDVRGADKEATPREKVSSIETFRTKIGINYLDYAACYFPWLNTTLPRQVPYDQIFVNGAAVRLELEAADDVQTTAKNLEFWYGNIPQPDDREGFAGTIDVILQAKKSETAPAKTIADATTEVNARIADPENEGASIHEHLNESIAKLEEADAMKDETDPLKVHQFNALLDDAADAINNALQERISTVRKEIKKYDSLLRTLSVRYNGIVNAITKEMNLLPPSGAMAGLYSLVDNTRGVWKAPANVSINSVDTPSMKITDREQENMNVDANSGKSINAIREFAGQGTLVWGARTLLGNDNEWRYISVRRFFIMVEQSLRLGSSWAVFEPNDSKTWSKIKGMIRSFLTDFWRQGALAGATPDEAFFVNVGLGSTMDAQDILEGRLNVEIGMAVVRPAEFIILKFSHKLQES